MIRRATINDIDDIKKLLLQVNNVHALARPDIFIPNQTKYNDCELKELIKNDNKPIFVYEENNKVIAHMFCIIEITKDSHILKDKKELYIDDLCVLDEYRKKGIGTKLYEFGLKYAKDNDFDYLTLNVWEGNNEAIKFYQNLGLSIRNIHMEKKLK